MTYLVFYKAIYIFCLFLECIIWIYFIWTLVWPKGVFFHLLEEFVAPFLNPIRKLLSKSILYSKVDFSAFIILMILMFIKMFMKNLSI